MKPLTTKLKEYADVANTALFVLHNAVRTANVAKEGDRWRLIYKARCDVAALMAQIIKEVEEAAHE